MLNYFIPFADVTTGDFNINFPLDLDVKIKSVLLGACFLLVSYENKNFDWIISIYINLSTL